VGAEVRRRNPRDPREIPASERYYFLEERYPDLRQSGTARYRHPRDLRRVRQHGLSVEQDRLCVYLDVTELPAPTLKKLDGILEIYEKFQGVDPRHTPMKIFPAIHYSMGGIWADYIKDEHTGGMVADHPRNHQTNVPGVYAIGEADYHYHGGNRLGANSLLSCIFTGLFVAPCVEQLPQRRQKVDPPAKLLDAAAKPLRRKASEDDYVQVQMAVRTRGSCTPNWATS
jgi:succinate dehydrogenase / fumarate reductase flavoprotein subunit